MNKAIVYVKYILGLISIILGPLLSIIWLISDKMENADKGFNIAPLLLFVITCLLGVILLLDSNKKIKEINKKKDKEVKFKPFKRKIK